MRLSRYHHTGCATTRKLWAYDLRLHIVGIVGVEYKQCVTVHVMPKFKCCCTAGVLLTRTLGFFITFLYFLESFIYFASSWKNRFPVMNAFHYAAVN